MNFKEGELKMKKLLVLLMVLGLVSSAQATLTLNLTASTIAVPGGTTTLTVSSSDTSNWVGDLILSEDLVNWTTPAAADWTTGTASGIGNIGTVLYNYYGHAATQIQVASNLTNTDVAAGTQFSIVLSAVQAGTIYIDLQDDTTYAELANGPLTLVVTPEPMTMALLGLGGLFLRRRK